MGAIGGMLGTAGGAGGSGFSTPQQANIQQGTNVGDVRQGQAGVNNSLQSQQDLLNALKNQNGLGQQSSLANQLSAANGVGTQNSAIAGLQGTAGQYQNIVNGTGPNPAQAMLNQATGQNVANQAALMAGQRGAGSNVGLMARQAAQQGANTQQQAVGQGATMQANQSLNALGGLSNTQQAIGGLGSTQAGMQAALANQIANQQIGGTSAYTQANMGNAGQLQSALGGYNNANVSSQGNVNTGNAGLAQTQMGNQGKIIGGIAQGGAMAGGMMAQGGVVHHMADGGDMYSATPLPTVSEPASSFTKFINGFSSGMGNPIPQPTLPGQSQYQANPNQDSLEKGSSDMTKMLVSKFKGYGGSSGDVAMAGGPEAAQTGSSLAELAPLAMGAEGGLAKQGGHVKAKAPTQKAVAKGNSYSNDKVPAMLSEGEVVIPRSVTMSADPIKNSAAFVAKVMAKRRGK